METFFVGVHHPDMGWPLSLRGHQVCISANVLTERQGGIAFVGQSEGWLLDSGAFTQIDRFGKFQQSPSEYAALIRRYGDWDGSGLRIAVAQDYMCEEVALARTGLTVADHQRMTIERFDAIRAAGTGRTPLMPVLQGWSAEDYCRHLVAYGDRLAPGAWVGVGSVCKRQGDPRLIAYILTRILAVRPDLRLHGFGVKKTALKMPAVREALHTADSMAWSYAARREGRDQNDWAEAYAYAQDVTGRTGKPIPPKPGRVGLKTAVVQLALSEAW